MVNTDRCNSFKQKSFGVLNNFSERSRVLRLETFRTDDLSYRKKVVTVWHLSYKFIDGGYCFWSYGGFTFLYRKLTNFPPIFWFCWHTLKTPYLMGINSSIKIPLIPWLTDQTAVPQRIPLLNLQTRLDFMVVYTQTSSTVLS